MSGVSIRVDDAVVEAALGRLTDRMAHARGLYDNIGAAMVVLTTALATPVERWLKARKKA